MAAPAAHVVLAVGPFSVVPDERLESMTHFCPAGMEKPLRDTVRFMHQPYDLYEQYLEASFPYSSLQQVRRVPGRRRRRRRCSGAPSHPRPSLRCGS